MTPNFDWSRYLRGIGAPTVSAFNVSEQEFFKAFNQLIAATSIDEVRTYLRWHLVHANAFLLSKSFVEENFRFYSAALQGVLEQRPRWKRCVRYVDGDLGEA